MLPSNQDLNYMVVISGFIGYGLLWYAASFTVALAVFIIHFSINVDRKKAFRDYDEAITNAMLKILGK